MAWDEWERLKAQVAERHATHMHQRDSGFGERTATPSRPVTSGNSTRSMMTLPGTCWVSEGIQEKLEKDSEPPMYLLGIGDESNGRSIIAYGTPDTADNVSAYVLWPGTNSSPNSRTNAEASE
ncbi:hypothetical protein [Streptomyces sp. NPDC001880]